MTKFNYIWSYMGRTLAEFGKVISPYITAGGGLPYKVYAAKITQNGTSNPTVTVLQNTLETTLTWTRAAAGRYTTGTLVLDTSKTTITCSIGDVPSPTVPVTIFSAISNAGASSYFDISTYANGTPSVLTDGVLQSSLVEIRIYD